MNCTLIFELQSYWHAGTGRGAGAVVDAVIHRDPSGLPELPGKTVRGLVRNAVQLGVAAGVVTEAQELEWFGSRLPEVLALQPNESSESDTEATLEEARFRTVAGVLWFGTATLPAAWRAFAAGGSMEATEHVAELTRHLASTAIGEDGLAKEHTLRVREVAFPMELRATVIGPDDDTWQGAISRCLPFLRALGSRRQRGYGRVDVRWERAP